MWTISSNQSIFTFICNSVQILAIMGASIYAIYDIHTKVYVNQNQIQFQDMVWIKKEIYSKIKIFAFSAMLSIDFVGGVWIETYGINVWKSLVSAYIAYYNFVNIYDLWFKELKRNSYEYATFTGMKNSMNRYCNHVTFFIRKISGLFAHKIRLKLQRFFSLKAVCDCLIHLFFSWYFS